MNSLSRRASDPRIVTWLLLSCAISLFGLSAPPAGARQAVALTGPFEGATIVDVATSPGLPHVLFVSLKDSSHWRKPQYSLDGGRTWHELATAPWDDQLENWLQIAVVPRADQSARFLVATGNGTVFRSGDFGATWAQAVLDVGEGLDYFAVSPADPQRLYASTSTEPTPPPLQGFVSTLFTSADGGVSWSMISEGIDATFGPITPSPSIAGRFYVRTGIQLRWYQSDDVGQHWTSQVFPIDILEIEPGDPARLYGLARAGNNINAFSIDGGKNWMPWDIPGFGIDLLPHPTKSRVLLLLTTAGLYRSADAGSTWQGLLSIAEGSLAADYGTPGRLLWARGSCLWASTTDGSTWVSLTAGCERIYLPVVRQ